MTNPYVGMPVVKSPSLAELDDRARAIFRRIVETYLETGEPVGSRTLSRGGVSLSPASIRNTMQDLAELGLLDAPHVSSGRMPTHVGLRLFVDGLLEVGDLAEDDRRAIEARLVAHGRSTEDALNEASAILSGLAGGAGIVVAPSREAGVKHVEFVALGPDQALAVMVFEDGQVENRLMRRPPDFDASLDQRAAAQKPRHGLIQARGYQHAGVAERDPARALGVAVDLRLQRHRAQRVGGAPRGSFCGSCRGTFRHRCSDCPA